MSNQTFDVTALRIDSPFRLCIAAWRSAAGSRHLILLYIGLSMAAQALTLGIPWIFAHAIDAVQKGNPYRGAEWMGLVLGVALVGWCLHGPSRILERSVALRIRRRVADGFLHHVLGLRLAWHDAAHSGETIDRILRASTALNNFVDSGFIYLQSAVSLVGPLVALFLLSHLVGGAAIAGYALAALVMIRLDRTYVRLLQTQNAAERRYAAALTDGLGNAKTVITLHLQEAVRTMVGNRLDAVFEPARSAIRINEIKWCGVDLINVCMRTGLVVLYGWIALRETGAIAVGSLWMIYQYAQQIGGVVGSMAGNCQTLVRHHADFGSMNEVLAEPREIADGGTLPESWQRLDIDNLSFAFEGADRPALNDVSVTLKRGKRIAIVGESGSGKSTLLAVLTGLYELPGTRITVDGNISPAHHLGSLATLIPQDPQVFAGSIEYNITLGLPYPPATIARATALTRLDPFLRTLPRGLESEIKERGANLSVGQRQRVALARGLLAAKSSSLIFLDEPTSSLDPATETAIYEAFLGAFGDACIVSTLHRLPLLQYFDEVIVMADGSVTDAGPRAEILARHPELRRAANPAEVEIAA